MKTHIDNSKENDNRNYDYSSYPLTDRNEYKVISDLVKPDSKVIDLACGNGSLLVRLQKEKNAAGKGMEVSKSGIDVCRKRGLSVLEGRIDVPLPFRDNEFDYAICNVTIQMVMYPEILLQEMKRIARYQIVSFPNFAFWRNRIDLMLNGRMPKRMLFEYKWYTTGHIHQLSFIDFQELVNDVGGLRIMEQRLEHSSNPVKNFLMQHFPNAFQMIGIVLLEKIS